MLEREVAGSSPSGPGRRGGTHGTKCYVLLGIMSFGGCFGYFGLGSARLGSARFDGSVRFNYLWLASNIRPEALHLHDIVPNSNSLEKKD